MPSPTVEAILINEPLISDEFKEWAERNSVAIRKLPGFDSKVMLLETDEQKISFRLCWPDIKVTTVKISSAVISNNARN